MTRDEVKKLLKVIADTYDTDVSSGKINVWHATLEEFTYAQMSAALMAYLKTDTKGFAPKPGQLIDQLVVVSESGEPSDEEYWAMIAKAIQNGNYGAAEEFEKLPPIAQKAVGSHKNIQAWALMDSDHVHSVIHSQVLRSIRSEKERAKNLSKIPVTIQQLITQTYNALEDNGGIA